MKNHEYIRKMRVRELAEFLVRSEEVNEGDEGMDGEWQDFYVTHYISPDGSEAYCYEDAVSYAIDWLNSDYKGLSGGESHED